MSQVLKIKFGDDIYRHIKLYTGEACWRRGKYITIRKISKDDTRYAVLLKKPHIKQLRNDTFQHPLKGCSWFKSSNSKFVVINVRVGYVRLGGRPTLGHIWEMHYNQGKTWFYLGAL